MKRFLDNRTGKDVFPKTLFKCEKIDNYLIFYFEAYNSSLNGYSNIDNDTLYQGDVVELFLDVGSEEYYEFEVAPNGATFVAKIINSTPLFIKKDFFESEVNISEDNYFVTMKIDLSKLVTAGKIKFNAFRIETKGIEPEYILEALSPTLSDSFHVKEKFVDLDV